MRITLVLIFVLVSIGWANTQTVYKTRTGKKYHIEKCQYVRNGADAITLEKARNVGLTACKVCKPGMGSARTQLISPPPPTKASANTSSTATLHQIAVQCKGKTQKGLRCKRKTRHTNAYCYQHVPGG